jgi:hypothetical protein
MIVAGNPSRWQYQSRKVSMALCTSLRYTLRRLLSVLCKLETSGTFAGSVLWLEVQQWSVLVCVYIKNVNNCLSLITAELTHPTAEVSFISAVIKCTQICHGDELCFLRGTNWDLKYSLRELSNCTVIYRPVLSSEKALQNYKPVTV